MNEKENRTKEELLEDLEEMNKDIESFERVIPLYLYSSGVLGTLASDVLKRRTEFDKKLQRINVLTLELLQEIVGEKNDKK